MESGGLLGSEGRGSSPKAASRLGDEGSAGVTTAPELQCRGVSPGPAALCLRPSVSSGGPQQETTQNIAGRGGNSRGKARTLPGVSLRALSGCARYHQAFVIAKCAKSLLPFQRKRKEASVTAGTQRRKPVATWQHVSFGSWGESSETL